MTLSLPRDVFVHWQLGVHSTHWCNRYITTFSNSHIRAGDLQQTQIRCDEKGLRIVGAVRLRNRVDNIQQQQ